MEKMSIINNPFQKAAQQIEAIYASKLHQITGASSVNLITASNGSRVKIEGVALHAKLIVDSEVTTAMLDSEAFNIPVNRLIDLWVARYGNKWIDLTELEDDEFFNTAFKRLKQLGEVEVHFLTDRARYVCRMPEQ
jgi:hypothetical protein